MRGFFFVLSFVVVGCSGGQVKQKVSSDPPPDPTVLRLARNLIASNGSDPKADLRILAELQFNADLNDSPQVRESASMAIRMYLKQNTCRHFPKACGTAK